MDMYFFMVLNSSDCWTEFFKHMFPKNKSSTFKNYKNGDIASALGYISLIRNKQDLSFSKTAIDNACLFGHFDVVKWLHKNRQEGCTRAAMDLACIDGHFKILKWLHKHRKEGITAHAMNFASAGGNFEIVKWLHQNYEICCTDVAMIMAASSGHQDIVEFLISNRKQESCTTRTMAYAVESKKLYLVKLLCDNCEPGLIDHGLFVARHKANEKFKNLKERGFNLLEQLDKLRPQLEIIEFLQKKHSEMI